MICRHVMTQDPACITQHEPVIEAARLMKQKGVGPIPIVESRDSYRLVGIVTDRDLALKVVAEGRDPNMTSVDAVMSRDLVTCHPDDDIEHAMRAMTKHKVRRVPVVDGRNRLVGIIAQADIARTEDEKKTGHVVQEISEDGETKN